MAKDFFEAFGENLTTNSFIQQTQRKNKMYIYKISNKYLSNYESYYPEDELKTLQYTSDTELDLKVKRPIKMKYDMYVFINHLVLVETTLDEDSFWSNTRERTLDFENDYLMEQIRTRYAFFDRPTSGLSNIIIDNYAPKLMYNTRFNQRDLNRITLPKTIYAISPWFAQYFGAQQVPTEQLCRILGYDVKALKQLVTKVKRHNYSISFVGYGGTNVNTIHWLTEIMKITQSVNLFNFIEIFEPEQLEISNLLRFPKNPYIENNIPGIYVPNASKLALLDPSEISLLSRGKANISTSRINGTQLHHNSKGSHYDSPSRRYKVKNNHIFYGAPTIDTRDSFKDSGHFISATHNGNSAHLWLNPTQDSDLQVESYGLIQLTPFFMNQLRLAIGLLEILAEGTTDFKEVDKLLLEYSFDGTAKLPTNKTYNFQLGSHNGLVATEVEAATEW